ncbi:MAG: hypothetical protein ACK4OM_05825, partial [Alphaproteobacteria bacterium]
DDEMKIIYGINSGEEFSVKCIDNISQNNVIIINKRGKIKQNNKIIEKCELEEKIAANINADLNKRELLKDNEKNNFGITKYFKFVKTMILATAVTLLTLTIPNSGFLLTLNLPAASSLPILDTLFATCIKLTGVLKGMVGSKSVASSLLCGVSAGIVRQTFEKKSCDSKWTDKIQKFEQKFTTIVEFQKKSNIDKF